MIVLLEGNDFLESFLVAISGKPSTPDDTAIVHNIFQKGAPLLMACPHMPVQRWPTDPGNHLLQSCVLTIVGGS